MSKIIDKALGAWRLSVCEGCPEKTILSGRFFEGTPFELNLFEEPVCGKLARPVAGRSCGCLLNIKANLTPFQCPQNKWKTTTAKK